MALELGTNCGFVSVAPVGDPTGTGHGPIQSTGKVVKDTSPVRAVKIIEIGWWCDNTSEEALFRVGLYAADGGVVPGEAGTRLYKSTDVAKGTDAGWKSIAVDWEINPDTDYWIAFGLNETASTTNTNTASSGGQGIDSISDENLPDPFAGGDLSDADGIFAIYAVYEGKSTFSKQVNLNFG